MADDSSDDRELDPSVDSLEEWLAEQAAREGVSEEELFQRLLSSYWTLNEVSQLLDSAEQNSLFGELSDREADDTTTDVRPDGEPQSSSDTRSESDGDTSTEEDEKKLYERLGLLEAKLEAEIERGTEVESQLRSAIEQLEATETEVVEHESKTRAQIRDLHEKIGAIESEITEEQDRIESRLDREFEDLETILEHLLTTTESLETQIERIERQQRSKTEALQSALEEVQVDQLQLQRLLQEAEEIGATSASCENCDTTIDLSLLASPECHNCGRRLTGIDEETKWFLFGDPIARTADSRAGNRQEPDRSRESLSETPTEPPNRPTDSAGRSTDDNQFSLGSEPDHEETSAAVRTGSESEQRADVSASEETSEQQSIPTDLPDDIERRIGEGSESETVDAETEPGEKSDLAESFDWQDPE
ncbi:hypothetical protein [Halobaculum sp. EA56]|uniref:hypothetical protein n=1 Tax=Halobaculum sp. EA56 TaxID=3421648 RepID=UPI003EB89D24